MLPPAGELVSLLGRKHCFLLLSAFVRLLVSHVKHQFMFSRSSKLRLVTFSYKYDFKLTVVTENSPNFKVKVWKKKKKNIQEICRKSFNLLLFDSNQL